MPPPTYATPPPGYTAPPAPNGGAAYGPGYRYAGGPYGINGSPGPNGAPTYPGPGGYPVPYPGYSADPYARSRTAAGLLGVFLGAFGVHRFYLGYTAIGILQIVVTVLTCGVGGLWGLIEGIMILAGSSSFRTDAHGRPLRD